MRSVLLRAPSLPRPSAIATCPVPSTDPHACAAPPCARPDADAEPRAPYLHAHQAGDSMWIDMCWVPPGDRGRGVGRRLVEAWEAALPADIRLVHLFAADTGAGPSDGFWAALGYTHTYDADDPSDLSYEATHRMWKGVNGHPTPPSWVVTADDDCTPPHSR